MTELEKRLEELSFRREYRYIEKTDIKNVKRIPHKQKRKPLIIEFSGVPKSGKSTCIEAVKKILSVNGFNVKVIEEKAPKCPLNKFNIMFNLWTYTNFLNELNEILQYNERFSNDKKYDVILCDRGGFDALVWFYWQLQKQSISLQEYNKLKELILWDRIWRNIQDVIVFKCEADDALCREPANSIFPGLNHSIMNRSVLDNLSSYIDIIEKEFEHCNTQIIRVESKYGEENKLKEEVLKKVLDCIERHYDEDIAYIQRKSLPLPLSTGVLSSTVVDKILQENLQFAPRRIIEANEEYLQIIPICCITTNKNQILCVKKNKEAVEKENGKAPELNKDLFYVGGHIRSEDRVKDKNLETFIKALEREIMEELGFSIIIKGKPKAVYDSSNPKSKKHLALYWIIQVDTENTEVKPDGNELLLHKGASKSGVFFQLSELTSAFNLENWSKEILRNEFYDKLSKEFIGLCLEGKTPLEIMSKN